MAITRTRGGAKKAPAKKAPAKKKIEKKKAAPVAAKKAASGGALVVEIESKASKMERLLKEEIPGVSVVTNPTKARKGTFEVRCGGKAIASFVSMPRPFKALREADLEKIAKDAAKACK
ncbi:hypothetical protein HKI87_11g66870 [Chloropicon roscoffensis]|uniref:Selenoprotein H n=1 Tax=Chloropicon roscoffensis TaxID=1461544 RepID=A0AAX4PGJ6_9CHLO